jgi:hypothetical protein
MPIRRTASSDACRRIAESFAGSGDAREGACSPLDEESMSGTVISKATLERLALLRIVVEE